MSDLSVAKQGTNPGTIPAPPPDDAPVAEHDRYWLKYVYRGDTMKQLTFRALASGAIIGSIMSFSNLYVGLKTGWGLGASITATILAFAFFSTWQRIRNTRDEDHFTELENNTMQTAASSAGYMTSAGLVSAVPALYLTTGQTMTFGQTVIWLLGVTMLGIVAAIPVKRKLINEERLVFPSGIACAETIRSLHAVGSEGIARARMLGWSGLAGVVVAVLRDGMNLIHTIPVFGARLAAKTVAMEPSLVMIGAGALMGLRVTISMVVAAAITFGVAPHFLYDAGFIECGKLAEGEVCTFEAIGYRDITAWTLWPGVAVMVAHSLVGLALQSPRMIKGLLKTFSRSGKEADPGILDGIEVPGSWFWSGLAVAGTFSIVLQNWLFNIPVPYAILSVALALGLAFVAARSVGETDINPTGAMGKVTQLVFGGLLRGQITPNLMAACVTGGSASQAGDLLTDLKTGYILGAKPRHQVIAQLVGVLVGSVFATMAYVILVQPEQLGGETWPAPAAIIWAKVAELLSKGVNNIEHHKLVAMGVAAAIGGSVAILEVFLPARVKRYMPSIAGIGIALMIPFWNSLSMLMGAVAALVASRVWPVFHERFTVVIASGVIAGETLAAVAILGKQFFWG